MKQTLQELKLLCREIQCIEAEPDDKITAWAMALGEVKALNRQMIDRLNKLQRLVEKDVQA